MEAIRKDHSPGELETLYDKRFSGREAYRRKVSRVTSGCFGRIMPASRAVLDLGCGYGKIINQVKAASRYAMDLNPGARPLRAGGGLSRIVGAGGASPSALYDGAATALPLVFLRRLLAIAPWHGGLLAGSFL
jgi:hypothetical protein